MSEMKNILAGTDSKSDTAEEKSSELNTEEQKLFKMKRAEEKIKMNSVSLSETTSILKAVLKEESSGQKKYLKK